MYLKYIKIKTLKVKYLIEINCIKNILKLNNLIEIKMYLKYG